MELRFIFQRHIFILRNLRFSINNATLNFRFSRAKRITRKWEGKFFHPRMNFQKFRKYNSNYKFSQNFRSSCKALRENERGIFSSSRKILKIRFELNKQYVPRLLRERGTNMWVNILQSVSHIPPHHTRTNHGEKRQRPASFQLARLLTNRGKIEARRPPPSSILCSTSARSSVKGRGVRDNELANSIYELIAERNVTQVGW